MKSRRYKYSFLKFIALVFFLNSVPLCLYLYSVIEDIPTFPGRRTEDTQTLLPGAVVVEVILKPWPILPSFLPWSENSNVRAGSCEGYFGNGFTHRHDVLSSSAGGGGWFRCYSSQTLRSSVCEGGKLRMVTEKIRMADGGERLEDVIGRDEGQTELPFYEEGAFEIQVSGDEWRRKTKRKNLVDKKFLDTYIPVAKGISRHPMRDLVASIQVVQPQDFHCDQWMEEPTLPVTRFEYANLFHTMTDWYNGYIASRVTGLPFRPRVVFLDGHCTSPMEETWNALFSGITYAKTFEGSVCFKHAVLSPLGYENVLFKGLSEHIDCEGASAHQQWKNPDDTKTARLSEFGEMIQAGFGLPLQLHHQPKSSNHTHTHTHTHTVLFIRREDYIAHPRHSGKPESRLSNEEQVFNSLKSWGDNQSTGGCKVNVVNGLFAHMSMKEQVRAIQQASVIVGAHGAGLTHVVAAVMHKTVVLEIISSSAYTRPHFALISKWRGLEYHAINLAGSHAHPPLVVDKLRRIINSLKC